MSSFCVIGTIEIPKAGCEEHTNSRANLWSDEQKSHMRSCMRARLHHKLKPNNYTESCSFIHESA